jgi:hypothetical protein
LAEKYFLLFMRGKRGEISTGKKVFFYVTHRQQKRRQNIGIVYVRKARKKFSAKGNKKPTRVEEAIVAGFGRKKRPAERRKVSEEKKKFLKPSSPSRRRSRGEGPKEEGERRRGKATAAH